MERDFKECGYCFWYEGRPKEKEGECIKKGEIVNTDENSSGYRDFISFTDVEDL